MKTTKGIALTFLGDGGVCIRCDWYENARNQLIAGGIIHQNPSLKLLKTLGKLKIRRKLKISNLKLKSKDKIERL